MKKNNILFLFLLLSISARAQDSSRLRIPFSITLLNNQTSLPIGAKPGILRSPIHPGFSLAYHFRLRTHKKTETHLKATLGYYYHRYVQHGIQLYGTWHYRYRIGNLLSVEGAAGLGYLHAISAVEVFKLNANGEYVKKKNWGSPKLMLPLQVALSVACRKNNPQADRFFIQYQFWMQAPFVKNYVPLLPNTALHLGYFHTLQFKKKGAGS